MMQRLLDAGADANLWHWGIISSRPVHHVRSAEAFALLVAHGADVNARNQHGHTALHELRRHLDFRALPAVDTRAASARVVELCDALIHAGLDVNALSCNGHSVLREVTRGVAQEQSAQVEIVERLIRAGASPHLTAFDGRKDSHPPRVQSAFGPVRSLSEWQTGMRSLVGEIASIEPGTPQWHRLCVLVNYRPAREELSESDAGAITERVRSLLAAQGDPCARSQLELPMDTLPKLLPAMAWLSGGVLADGSSIWGLAANGAAWRCIVEAGVSPDIRGCDGYAALHHRLKFGRWRQVDELHLLGIPDDSWLPSVSVTAVASASMAWLRHCHPDRVPELKSWVDEVADKLVIHRMRDVLGFDDADWVHRAAREGHPVDDLDRQSPLATSIAEGWLHSARALLACGADPNGTRTPPLREARTPEAVQLLLTAGSDIHRSCSVWGASPALALLQGRSRSGESREQVLAACRLLIRAGCDPSLRDHRGESVLTVLQSSHDPASQRLLSDIRAATV